MLVLLGLVLSQFVVGEKILSLADDSQEQVSRGLPRLAPAVYVFGDSMLDSGNNNWLPTLSKANYYPYGLNFPYGPTGRFTNGKTFADFIAEYLGLPYPPPYVSLPSSDSLTGYNYASASSGILPLTGAQSGLCLNLEAQVKLFEETVRTKLTSKLKDHKQVSQHLAKSIFIVAIGSNDYLLRYFDPLSGLMDKLYNPQQFTQLLVHKLSQQLQKLYRLGARKIVVSELGPIGCIPSVVIRRVNDGQKCDEKKNELASIFNHHLALMLNKLMVTLPGSHFILGHAYWLGYDVILNPAKYGISDVRNPCCKTWGNGTLSCIPGLKPCKDANTRYFYDGYHPTETISSLIAAHCIHDSDVCLPMNIRQLVNV